MLPQRQRRKVLSKSRFALLIIVTAAITSFFVLGGHEYLSLEYLRDSRVQLEAFYRQHPIMLPVMFFGFYVAVTALSLPGAAVMTLAAGALFGLSTGVALVSFASSAGATLAFLAARWLLRDTVQRRMGDRLELVSHGIERDGGFYLFSMRLVPAIPFFLINLAMGLTPIRTWTFYWVSQLGMLPGTIVYVNAGTQLADVRSLQGLVSFDIVGAFLLLAAFPWIGRAALRLIQRRRALRGWHRPKSYDRNLIVIGAGSAGLVSAYIAATTRASVTLVEQQRMGGDCLNTGCVPSKALIKSARVMHQTRHLSDYGIKAEGVQADFSAVMERVQRVIAQVEPHDSVELYTALGVECRIGKARLTSPWEVEIRADGGAAKRLTSRNIVIATGARPKVPPIPGLAELNYLTSENLWELRQRPDRLLVLGGGPIGCELAQAFARLGARVTQLERKSRLLSKDEPEASEAVLKSLEADGVEVLLDTTASRFVREGDRNVLIAEHDSGEKRIGFEEVLVALGRTANTAGLGLAEIGIETRNDGTILTDDYLQTTVPGIYACGDAAGPYQFTHAASHQAWYATVNALFGTFRRFKVDYSVIPWTTFTDPEVAHVGLTQTEAEARGLEIEITCYGIDDLDRAIADGTNHGFIKVLTRKGSDRIFGATIVGADAGNLLAEFILAMRHGLGLKKLHEAIHVYPTLSEAVKYSAGEWRKAHAPAGLLDWVGRYHRWRLGGSRGVSSSEASRANVRSSA